MAEATGWAQEEIDQLDLFLARYRGVSQRMLELHIGVLNENEESLPARQPSLRCVRRYPHNTTLI